VHVVEELVDLFDGRRRVDGLQERRLRAVRLSAAVPAPAAAVGEIAHQEVNTARPFVLAHEGEVAVFAGYLRTHARAVREQSRERAGGLTDHLERFVPEGLGALLLRQAHLRVCGERGRGRECTARHGHTDEGSERALGRTPQGLVGVLSSCFLASSAVSWRNCARITVIMGASPATTSAPCLGALDNLLATALQATMMDVSSRNKSQ
jgi:hypothetical protein